MRLIGTFETEGQAYSFYSLLLKEGIQNIYEPFIDEKTNSKHYRIWVCEENDLERALEWMHRYKENPHDPEFQKTEIPKAATPPSPGYSEISQSEDLKWQTVPPSRFRMHRFSFPLTYFILMICGFLFLWNDFEENAIAKDKGELAAEIAMTPMQKDLLFDYPSAYQYIQEMIDTVPLQSYKEMKQLPPEALAYVKKADEAPAWRGIFDFFITAKNKGWQVATDAPMFEKIKQGQIWRFFTPCLMHGSFLHILFNMIWAFLLLKQLEQRMHRAKLCLLILIIGILSNIAQYLVSGPYFLGFSGIIVGLAGFIWMRQKRAPWEGYPLQRSTLLFLLFFVIAMFLIELLTFSLQMLSVIQLSPNIANTAHVIGGCVGMYLGRLSFFGRRMS